MKLALEIINLINQLNIPISWAKSLQKIISWTDKLFFRLPASVHRAETTLKGIPVEVFSPKDKMPERTIFYIHGGGFLLGLNMIYRRLAAKISFEMRAQVWLVEYPILPDNEFPTALDACFRAYDELAEKVGNSKPLILMGDSAGGNLAVACLYLLKESQVPLPQGVALFSPWLDLTLSGKSLIKNVKTDPIIMPSRMPELVKLYLREKVSQDHYLASPLYGCVKGIPPLFIAVGNHEVLQDDALRLAHKAQNSSVQVTVEIGEKMPHAYPVLFPSHPQSIKCFQALKSFLETIK